MKDYRAVLQTLFFLPDLYLVGGAVRDILLGREPEDLDFATSAPPEETIQLVESHGLVAIPTGLEHGTIAVLIDRRPYEVTTFRQDVETFGRKARVRWGNSIEEDLARRDFTIGAIAMNAEGRVIDPFGGQQDIEAGILRAVGDPEQRFREDYLRVIRAGRFAARYGFEIEEKTMQAAREAAPQVLSHVAIERVTAEFDKAFAAPHVADSNGAPSRFVRYLYDLEILQRLIPEFEDAHLLLQNPRWHPERDVLSHILKVIDLAPPKYRWHALLHDIGKKDTARWKPEGWYSFHGHEQVGAQLIPRIARELRLPNHLRDEILVTTALHMVPVFTKPTPRAIRRFQAEAGVYLPALEALYRADAGDRRPPESWKFFEPQPVPVRPILSGRHLVARGHRPGVEFGQMLQAAFEHQLETGETDLERLYAAALTGLEAGKQGTKP
ncbi:CCA tRNA nucleotidyltransferase [uncultured Meiothermus sp.]|jgi:poly(A) polymerase/tRNA nucleotidyltransferase (CCA-adding enzyme)|uniref:CCA tRNA nucleotidyltransferase n=1 Tax=uncultured Meiothermus sp. TaxID=157471 RepID=UPI0026062D54|nr:CCA tRNA nucleotidyltransferase [uncultured Meiothermus sp.]